MGQQLSEVIIALLEHPEVHSDHTTIMLRGLCSHLQHVRGGVSSQRCLRLLSPPSTYSALRCFRAVPLVITTTFTQRTMPQSTATAAILTPEANAF